MRVIDETWMERRIADVLGCFMCGSRAFIRRCPRGLCQSLREVRDANRSDWKEANRFGPIHAPRPYTRLDHLRYVRQFMFQHIAQMERAVIETLGAGLFGAPRALRVLDVGSGPGTLFIALVALSQRRHPALRGFSIEYCPLDPSRWFMRFLEDTLSQHCKGPGVFLGHVHCGDLRDVPPQLLRDVDWFFLGNALTAIKEQTGTLAGTVNLIAHSFDQSNRRDRVLTIAENSAAKEVFAEFSDRFKGGHGKVLARETKLKCRAYWLKNCSHSVRSSGFRHLLPRAVLHLANFMSTGVPRRESLQEGICGTPRRGAKWSSEEDLQLREEFGAGNSIEVMAACHGRNAGGIIARLEKLGLMEPTVRSAE